jgi:hypothetical protein
MELPQIVDDGVKLFPHWPCLDQTERVRLTQLSSGSESSLGRVAAAPTRTPVANS